MNIPRLRGASVGIVATGALILASFPSAATAAPILNVEYDAVGSAHIASTDSTIDLGPTILSTQLDFATLEFEGSMPLPGTRTEFEVAGFVPVTADVSFEEAAPITGVLENAEVGSTVNAVAQYDIRLSNIKVAGFPIFAGPFCRTAEPITIPIESPPEGGFDIFTGGEVGGEFTIGNFEHCGLNTWLINQIIPGSGNHVEIEIANARVSS